MPDLVVPAVLEDELRPQADLLLPGVLDGLQPAHGAQLRSTRKGHRWGGHVRRVNVAHVKYGG